MEKIEEKNYQRNNTGEFSKFEVSKCSDSQDMINEKKKEINT